MFHLVLIGTVQQSFTRGSFSNRDMNELIRTALEESSRVSQSLIGETDTILRASELIASAFKRGQKLLTVGNGGAASDAQHLAAEFVATYKMKRPGLPAICLNSNASTTTAWTNDFSFETLYERQVEAFGKAGDVLIALTSGGGMLTPGPSSNIARAAKKAKEMNLTVIGFSGKSGGALKEISDLCIVVKSQVTARIQEAHMALFHIIIELVDERLFGNGKKASI